MTHNFTIYVTRDEELEPNLWAVSVNEDKDGYVRTIGSVQNVSAYDVMSEVAKIIDKAAVPA